VRQRTERALPGAVRLEGEAACYQTGADGERRVSAALCALAIGPQAPVLIHAKAATGAAGRPRGFPHGHGETLIDCDRRHSRFRVRTLAAWRRRSSRRALGWAEVDESAPVGLDGLENGGLDDNSVGAAPISEPTDAPAVGSSSTPPPSTSEVFHQVQNRQVDFRPHSSADRSGVDAHRSRVPASRPKSIMPHRQPGSGLETAAPHRREGTKTGDHSPIHRCRRLASRSVRAGDAHRDRAGLPRRLLRDARSLCPKAELPFARTPEGETRQPLQAISRLS